jgi:hypothetical protein
VVLFSLGLGLAERHKRMAASHTGMPIFWKSELAPDQDLPADEHAPTGQLGGWLDLQQHLSIPILRMEVGTVLHNKTDLALASTGPRQAFLPKQYAPCACPCEPGDCGSDEALQTPAAAHPGLSCWGKTCEM